ncbi:DUF481 domain-containing protein [Paracoccus aestuariivivens]|uniref:DUF481 domain-containing protein n=1 Tax=Paracoccus aestuariivivens TaxID=1820333 RepID=A0A6L6JFQ8_9RHOB|nr:DUF481 domain-containing protein [Paracoccus aestuariivivens]MTH80115.1 DUF481 domain-containing protein [Paracoccus aestuariivivens]
MTPKQTPIWAAALLALSGPALAQSEIATGANATGISIINERLNDVEDAAQDDFSRSADAARFANPNLRQGLFGSVAMTYAGRSGNAENQDFSLAGRLSYNQGQFAQSLGLLLEYGESDSGGTDTKDAYAIYDGQYYFDDNFYAFALGRLTVDGLAGDPEDDSDEAIADQAGRLKRDAFLGFGPGYRVLGSDQTTWRLQAGLGLRYTKAVNVSTAGDIGFESNTEAGYIVSSRFFHRISDTVFLTNDTDYLTSDTNDTATNEFGLNFKVTDSLSTRVSYRSEYVSDRAIRTDNTLGLSLVYGF